ncbi:VTC domain-containing protein, partial [Patescibacteria group bacterium]
KLRLRTYSLLDLKKEKEIFFEIKRKQSATIIKDRGIFSYNTYKLLKENKKIFFKKNKKEIRKKETLESFLALKKKFNMTPRLKVIYDREPLEAVNYKNLRITFDSNIQACRANDNSTNGYYKKLLPKKFVLEVKFRGILPYWFHNIIQKYQLQRISFSKYCQAVETVL